MDGQGWEDRKMVKRHPTPYPDVNEILNNLLVDVKDVLGDQFVGMYLFGSLANGGFDKDSDIDVLVVTDAEISDDTFSTLAEMHKRIAKVDSPWAIQLEVSYIPREALRRFDLANMCHPHLDRGSDEKLHMMEHANDWIIQRHILRERGVIIAGPDPKMLIDPVSPDDLRQAIVDMLSLWFNPIFENPSQINKRGYQSFFVLSICRMFYTLKYGEIVSKKFAAEWAKENLDARWRPLIEHAWLGRQNPGLEAQPEDISETLEMMRYALQQIRSTLYPDVNEVLNLVLAEAQNVLGDQFVGMYLYGSLSSGDFDPASSDIDFLVVTTEVLPEKTIADLEVMHQNIWETGLKWADKLEGSYLPKKHLRRYEKSDISYPTVNEHKFYVAPHGSDWIIQRHIIREGGVILAGPDPKSLIDPVGPDDIRHAVTGVLQEWWFPMLEDPSWLREHGSVYHAFAILTMCRSLCALERGTVVSKRVAAKWAQQTLGGKCPGVIEQALAAQKGDENSELLNDALELIRYTMEKVNIMEER
jgi:predicted nucleotidyltransferase